MEALQNKTGMTIPIEAMEEAKMVAHFISGMDMSDRRTFMAFIHGIEYKEMLDLSNPDKPKAS